VVAALEKPLGYEIINLGVGAPISLREFINECEVLSGRALHTQDVPTPASDPPITYCDNSKARDLLGFAPRVQVHEGLAKTWEWFKGWQIEAGSWVE
jgi:UDP-glucuronate 4-epimerase